MAQATFSLVFDQIHLVRRLPKSYRLDGRLIAAPTALSHFIHYNAYVQKQLPPPHVILSAAKDLKLWIITRLRTFDSAQDDTGWFCRVIPA